MTFPLQELIVYVVVLIAALYAGRKMIAQFRSTGESEGCGKCGCENGRAETNTSGLPRHLQESLTRKS